jgi:hypothetical protein
MRRVACTLSRRWLDLRRRRVWFWFWFAWWEGGCVGGLSFASWVFWSGKGRELGNGTIKEEAYEMVSQTRVGWAYVRQG